VADPQILAFSFWQLCRSTDSDFRNGQRCCPPNPNMTSTPTICANFRRRGSSSPKAPAASTGRFHQVPDLLPVVSLFCGPGGMDLGFRQAGFEPVVALDASKAAVETYNWNDPQKVARQCDLSSISGNELIAMVREIGPGRTPCGVIGGPPCQSFSRGNTSRNPSDPRAKLGLAYARLLRSLNKEFGLDFFVFENVVGLRSERNGERFQSILRALKRAGFNVFVGELEASEFGVPQMRRRLLIVGLNRNKFPHVQFEFPRGSAKPPTVRDIIGKFPTCTFFARDLRPDSIQFHPNHWTMNPLSPKFSNGMHGNGRSFIRQSLS